MLFFISLLDSVARIIIDDSVAAPVTTTSAPVVFPLVDVDTFVVVSQIVSESSDFGQKPVDATSTVSTTNFGGVPATVPQNGQTMNDVAKMSGGTDMVVSVQYCKYRSLIKKLKKFHYLCVKNRSYLIQIIKLTLKITKLSIKPRNICLFCS